MRQRRSQMQHGAIASPPAMAARGFALLQALMRAGDLAPGRTNMAGEAGHHFAGLP
jgi:hypothetical protein